MSKDFLCEDTRAEFEMACEEMHHLIELESNRSGRSTLNNDKQVEWQRQKIASRPTSLANDQMSDRYGMSCNDLSRLVPWQNIGGHKEHIDLYQRYTMDTRFVPEEYRELVDVLLQLESLDAELLRSAVKNSFPERKESHKCKVGHDAIRFCTPPLKGDEPNRDGRKQDFSQAQSIMLMCDDIEYNYEKNIQPKLQASLSMNVGQSDTRGSMKYVPDVRHSDQGQSLAAKANIQVNHASLKDKHNHELDKFVENTRKLEKANNETADKTTSKYEQKKKCSKDIPASGTWGTVKRALVIAGSITAATLVFKRFF